MVKETSIQLFKKKILKRVYWDILFILKPKKQKNKVKQESEGRKEKRKGRWERKKERKKIGIISIILILIKN